jgi:carbamoylphosphate synthase large subunit
MPAYTMGGTGGGLVYNIEELEVVMKKDCRPVW